MLYGIDLAFYLLFILAASISLLSFYTPGIPSASLLNNDADILKPWSSGRRDWYFDWC